MVCDCCLAGSIGLAGAAAVGWALGWAHLAFWRQKLCRPVGYDQTHRIATPDGCAFELRRLQPTQLSHQPPVLLCHGVAINHRNLDADENLSLARSLRAAGRDVWLLTLRSGRDDLSYAERKVTSFSAMVAHDVPLAVQQVRQRTGAEQIDYIGFSMGGILWYACLNHTVPQLQVRRTVIMGSPGRIGHYLPFIGILKRLPPQWMPSAPLRLASQMVAFAAEALPTYIHRVTMNLANCQPGYVRHTAMEAVQSIAGPLAHDFIRWANSDGVPRLDTGRDVFAGLATVDVPVLMVGGQVDRLCPPSALQIAFDRWGCNLAHTPKRMLLLGKIHGHRADYGHTDLTIGQHAAEEVFAPIVAFLS
ncbi:MAG: alpha/beta fold hydrolase [Myxococcales bacterium]|nr:alpha/beta fold hydrolase [Myxococcales bacterium]